MFLDYGSWISCTWSRVSSDRGMILDPELYGVVWCRLVSSSDLEHGWEGVAVDQIANLHVALVTKDLGRRT